MTVQYKVETKLRQKNFYGGVVTGIAVFLIFYSLLVRSLDADPYIPTEPDDPYIKSLPELIGDPCRVHDLDRC